MCLNKVSTAFNQLLISGLWRLLNQLIGLASGVEPSAYRSLHLSAACHTTRTHPPTCRQIDKRLIQHSNSDRPIVCLSLSALLIQEPFVTLHLPPSTLYFRSQIKYISFSPLLSPSPVSIRRLWRQQRRFDLQPLCRESVSFFSKTRRRAASVVTRTWWKAI